MFLLRPPVGTRLEIQIYPCIAVVEGSISCLTLYIRQALQQQSIRCLAHRMMRIISAVVISVSHELESPSARGIDGLPH
jgi:hypothetical protein